MRLGRGRSRAQPPAGRSAAQGQPPPFGQWLHRIVADAIDATLLIDAAGRIRDANAPAGELLGRPTSDLLGEQATTLLPVLTGDGRGTPVPQNLLSIYPHAVRLPETRLPPLGGSRRPVEVTVCPVRGSGEQLLSVTIRDLTVDKRTQASSGNTAAMMRAITERGSTVTIAFSLADANRGQIEFANRAASQLLGYQPHQLEQLRLDDITFVEERETILDRMLAAELGSRAEMQLETRLKDHDGDPIWSLLSFSAHGESDGLPKRIGVIQATDIRERKRFEFELQSLADHDSLTGLYNRRRFEEELRRAVAQISRYGGSCALMVVDVDGFKYVNDTLGHAAGDELLRRVAHLLRLTMRETDVIARTGGDEFAAILPATNATSAAVAGRKVLQTMSAAIGDRAGGSTARITVSVGLTAFDQLTGLAPEDLMIEADLAMYQAKEAGKDQLAVYVRANDRRAQLSRRETLRSRLRSALEANSFEVLTQPICRLADGKPTMVTLLPHIRGPQGELIEPASFLEDDERTGLRRDVDAWTLREALRLLRVNVTQVTGVPIVVRMSARTLENPTMLGQIGVDLGLSPISRGSLVIELGASAPMRDPDYVINVARGLQKLGCRLSIAHFESVIPALPAMHDLHFEYLKVDGALATEAVSDSTSRMVVKMVSGIAAEIGSTAAAGSVANADGAAALATFGVALGEGPAFGHPQPARLLLPSAY